VYPADGASVGCSFAATSRLPLITCTTRRLSATMDARRVVFNRAGKRVAVVAQRAGAPVYGPYEPAQPGNPIVLGKGATVGFLGTNVACTALLDGSAPALRCLPRGGLGLPGRCCGPNFGLLVGGHGFLLSPRRLEELLVVGTGVYTGSGSHPAPFRVVKTWRR